MPQDGPDLLKKATGSARVRLDAGPSFTDTPRTPEEPKGRPVPTKMQVRRLSAWSLVVYWECRPPDTPALPSPLDRAGAVPAPVGAHAHWRESRPSVAVSRKPPCG